jgi:hypothetical protein
MQVLYPAFRAGIDTRSSSNRLRTRIDWYPSRQFPNYGATHHACVAGNIDFRVSIHPKDSGYFAAAYYSDGAISMAILAKPGPRESITAQ